jgi:hypothetical protein
MGQQSRIAVVFLAVIFILLQGAMIAFDQQATPARVAKRFAQEYFALKPEMAQMLCKELSKEDIVVNDFLNRKQYEADQRGLPLNYLRRMFTHLQVEVLKDDQKSAQIRLTGSTRVAINPVFMVVGKIFGIGENIEVEGMLELVKEEDGWRVCGTRFDLTPEV